MPAQPFFRGLNKTNTAKEARSIVNSYENGEDFESDFISDLIQEKHYYCSLHNIRPTHFKKESRGAKEKYDFYGFFTEKNKWHKVSWLICTQKVDRKKWAIKALRNLIQPEMYLYKSDHEMCESCNNEPATEVDHVFPEFDKMASESLELMSETDWIDAFKSFDFWEEGEFKLPNTSQAVAKFKELHSTAQLQAVCTKCHSENSKLRKMAKPGHP